MQKFKQIREAAKYNPYAIGMAAAKKKAGITAKHAEGLPKAVIVKGHEIAKKIKANEEFDSVLEQLDFELSLEAYTAEELQAFMESEDFNQLDEISKATLGSYIKKASHSAAISARFDDRDSPKAPKTAVKRLVGIKKAADKLAKE